MAIPSKYLSWKYLLVGAVITGFLLQAGFRFLTTGSIISRDIATMAPPAVEEQGVGVVIDAGDGTVISGTLPTAASAYEALTTVARERNLEVGVREFDFGMFVERIGTYSSTPQKAWLYYVNDQSGDVAADKKAVQPGDRVEWKYEQPK